MKCYEEKTYVKCLSLACTDCQYECRCLVSSWWRKAQKSPDLCCLGQLLPLKITQAKLRKILFQISFSFLTLSAATHIAVEKSSDSLTMLNYVQKYIKVVDRVLHNLRKATFLFLCFFQKVKVKVSKSILSNNSNHFLRLFSWYTGLISLWTTEV